MKNLFENEAALRDFESKLKAILPEKYQGCYEEVEPVSMGSAGLKYTADGQVAWDEIWATFCDLAMAGGPPHKGKLLRPGSREEIQAEPDRYRNVVTEIRRGIEMVTDLACRESSNPGWVRVQCRSEAMAGWLARAIVMENVSAHCERMVLSLPAGPTYRVEKEIKNVITAIAKTGHYWFGHIPPAQQAEIGRLFAKMDAGSPLIQPSLLDSREDDRRRALSAEIAGAIGASTGLACVRDENSDWVGVECRDVRAAISMMRAAVVAGNVVSRREGKICFVPVNPVSDPGGETVVAAVRQAHSFSMLRQDAIAES